MERQSTFNKRHSNDLRVLLAEQMAENAKEGGEITEESVVKLKGLKSH